MFHLNDGIEAFEAVEKFEDRHGRKCMKVVILHETADVQAFNERQNPTASDMNGSCWQDDVEGGNR